VDKACDGILQDVLSANATKPYHQPETYVEPDVGHVIPYTWRWLFARCYGLVGGCAEFVRRIRRPYQP